MHKHIAPMLGKLLFIVVDMLPRVEISVEGRILQDTKSSIQSGTSKVKMQVLNR